MLNEKAGYCERAACLWQLLIWKIDQKGQWIRTVSLRDPLSLFLLLLLTAPQWWNKYDLTWWVSLARDFHNKTSAHLDVLVVFFEEWSLFGFIVLHLVSSWNMVYNPPQPSQILYPLLHQINWIITSQTAAFLLPEFHSMWGLKGL